MRHPDWENRLLAFIAAGDRPYSADGRWDCMTMALGVVEAVTGRDHAIRHRGRYRSRIGAARYLKSLGFESVEAALDSILDEKPVAFAQLGDLILASDGIPAACMGGVALSVGPDGWVQVPRSEWVKAWRVGPRRKGKHRRRNRTASPPSSAASGS